MCDFSLPDYCFLEEIHHFYFTPEQTRHFNLHDVDLEYAKKKMDELLKYFAYCDLQKYDLSSLTLEEFRDFLNNIRIFDNDSLKNAIEIIGNHILKEYSH
jgi:hypothetical protein